MTENSSDRPIKINVKEVGDFTCPWYAIVFIFLMNMLR